jgi:hypothetical protein
MGVALFQQFSHRYTRSHKTVGIKVFVTIFAIEGSGAESKSRRFKNIPDPDRQHWFKRKRLTLTGGSGATRCVEVTARPDEEARHLLVVLVNGPAHRHCHYMDSKSITNT